MLVIRRTYVLYRPHQDTTLDWLDLLVRRLVTKHFKRGVALTWGRPEGRPQVKDVRVPVMSLEIVDESCGRTLNSLKS